MFAVTYLTGYSYSGDSVVTDNKVVLSLALRTLGITGASQSVDALGGGTSGTSSMIGGL